MVEGDRAGAWGNDFAGRRALVTGATGFLGSMIVEQLLDRGATVRVLARSAGLVPSIEERGIDVVVGALTDERAVERAMDGVAYVFHVAADLRMYPAAYDEAYRSNVTATRVLVEGAERAGVERFVYTSSGSTLGKPHDAFEGAVRTIDESCAYNFDGLGWVYPPTKYLGELEVLAACRRGLHAVITHPTAIFGPGDWKKNLLPLFRASSQWLGRFATRGTRSVCDVRDVAEGHLRAAVLGRAGERYALSGELLTVRELMSEIAASVGGRGPSVELPVSVVLALAKASQAIAETRGRAPLFSPEMAMQSCFRVWISSAKAERELGYRSRPARESIRDTADFYRARRWL